MKKMLIALLLALTLLVSAVPSFAEEAPKELKFVYIDGWSSVDDGDTTSAITQKIAEETGVLISPVTAGGDRGTILLSSGEVGDCLMVYSATMLKTCVENGMMLDLSTLVSEEKTPAILSNPDRIQMAQVLSETDDGSYYFLPVQCGSEGAPMTPYHSLFNVRWDLYKQMGYPEVTDTDSMLALLSEMQKLNPTTEDGKTVSTSWAQDGRNKLSLSLELNLKHPEVKELFFGLIKEADVFMENMVWLEKLGIRDNEGMAE